MHQQKVQNPPTSPLQGIAVVLGLVAAALADTLLSQVLQMYINDIFAFVVFWVLGMSLAAWVIHRYALSYVYNMNSVMLQVNYSYGRRQRLMIEIYFANVLACGTLEEMKAAYPDARPHYACLKRCSLPTLTVACRDNGKPALYILQPDEAITERLLQAAAQQRKKK